MSFRAASIKCQVCGKTVYAMEAMQADGKTFHKGCMKCAECNGVLKLGNYAAVGGKYYCKPHFKQLFKLKGNYSSGFGEDKGENKASHSFAVPTGRVDFNRSSAGSGVKASPVKGSPSSSPAPSHSPAPSTPSTTVTEAPAPEKPASAVPPTVAVPHLASPTPTHRVVPTATPPSLGSSGGGAPAIGARGLGSSGGGSSFENEKSKFEAEKKAFEDEKRRFDDEKKKKDAELKAAAAAAEKELAAAKEAAASAPKEAPASAPAPVTLSSSEILICDAFSALLAEPTKKDLALRKVGLAK